MDTYYNYKEYNKYISDKYTFSEKEYKKEFKKEPPEIFLSFYEGMNVYPVYPRAIVMPLKKKGDKHNIKLKLGSKPKFDENVCTEMVKISEILTEKLNEPKEIMKAVRKRVNKDKVRRFFDYEIRDKVSKYVKDQKVTNAWVKMYELLHTYNFCKNYKNNTITTFHLCEHPGAFVFATKHYIENYLKLKHKFYYQSLKPDDNPKIFKPDPQLLKDHPGALDYGPFKGDVTKKDNILYYRRMYQKKGIDLITSDCGLDFSSDFTKQEMGLYKVYLGALVSAIALSSDGTDYVFKMFSFNTQKTVELLQIACVFWERVDLVRLLTTKSMSGEIYCICNNFNYKGDIKKVLDTLLQYMEEDKNSDKYIVSSFDPTFVNYCENHHKLLTIRRITSQNMFMFRFINYDYANEQPQVKDLVRTYADYYAKYFIKLFKLK